MQRFRKGERTMREITNAEDIIDSRDVIERIAELGAHDEAREAVDTAAERLRRAVEDQDHEDTIAGLRADVADAMADLDETPELDEDEAAELKALREFADEGDQLADWPYGETLIRYTYFAEYAEQLAEDLGVIDRDASWPLRHIDWQAAADELVQDYTSIDFDGVTYYGRS